MADIQVVFQNKKPTLVLQDPEAVMQEEILNWHFHTAGTPVRAVRITFAKKSARFFPRPTHSPKPARKPNHKIKKPVTNGQTIWGKAPVYFKSGPPKTRSDRSPKSTRPATPLTCAATRYLAAATSGRSTTSRR